MKVKTTTVWVFFFVLAFFVGATFFLISLYAMNDSLIDTNFNVISDIGKVSSFQLILPLFMGVLFIFLGTVSVINPVKLFNFRARISEFFGVRMKLVNKDILAFYRVLGFVYAFTGLVILLIVYLLYN